MVVEGPGVLERLLLVVLARGVLALARAREAAVGRWRGWMEEMGG